MLILIYSFIFILGLMFGSFSSVLLTRLKTGEKGIMNGRSHCPKCGHFLSFFDLFPVFSYIFRGGKCAYCKTKISLIYPVLELSMGILFLISTYFLIDINLLISGNSLEMVKLFFYLFISFIAFIIAVYDIMYLEISDIIVLVGIVFVFTFVALQTINPDFRVLNTFSNAGNNLEVIVSSIILSTGIITLLYTIIFAELKEIYDFGILSFIILTLIIFSIFFQIDLLSVPILSAVIGALGLFIFLFLQIVLSGGRRMGAGDLRIAIFMGLLLGGFYSIIGGFLTYLVGSIIGVIIIIRNKLKGKKALGIEVPFGPFLIIGILASLYFQNELFLLFGKIFLY